MIKNFGGIKFEIEKDTIRIIDTTQNIFSDEINFLELTDEELKEIIYYHYPNYNLNEREE